MSLHHGQLSREEKKKIRKERKALRKDLKLKGITKREEFEEIARMLGLVIYEDRTGPLFWWWRFCKWFLALGAAKYLAMIAVILGLIVPFAIMANQKGNFVVSMTDELSMMDFRLTEHDDGSNDKNMLKSEVLNEVNPYSIQDLPDGLDDIEGCHNMDDVVAYTFWITNNGDQAIGYDYYLILSNATRDVEEATWLMLYDEGKQTIYAKASQDGSAEKIYNCAEAPLIQDSADPESQYIDEDGVYTVVSKTFEDHNLVKSGTVDTLQPGESHKYTVIIWVEGDDPDCENNIIGGHGGYHMRFTTIGDTEDFEEQYRRYIE